MSGPDPRDNGGGAGRTSPAEAQGRVDEEAREDRLDWCNDADIVVPSQPATAVYLNGDGAIVIRQEGLVYEDDPFIFIRPAYALALCDAILRAAGVRKPLALPAPQAAPCPRCNGHGRDSAELPLGGGAG